MKVKSYNITPLAVQIITTDDKINTIPMMHVQDVSYSKGSITINFCLITLNTKDLRFGSKEQAEAFHETLIQTWYEYE